jgi:hypothetical protein
MDRRITEIQENELLCNQKLLKKIIKKILDTPDKQSEKQKLHYPTAQLLILIKLKELDIIMEKCDFPMMLVMHSILQILLIPLN